MSDAHLRALELATRTAPGDLEAARAYTRALERAGRRREALRETCRRVRLGDPGAVDEVERATRPERQPGLLRAPREVIQATLPDGFAQRSIAAGDLLLLDLHASPTGELLALGPDLAPRWRHAHPAGGSARPGFRSLACGPDLVHLEGSSLLLRAGEDGRELARVEVPVGEWPDQASGSVWGDLVLIGCPPLPPEPPGVDVPSEEPGPRERVLAFRVEEGRFAPLWSRGGQSPVLAGPSRVAIGFPHLVWLGRPGGIELAAAADGATGKVVPREDATQACDLDPRGLIVTRPEGSRETLLEELGVESGETRWSCHVPGERLRLLGLAPERAWVLVGRFGDGALVAIDRTSGAIAWRRTWRHADSVLDAAPAEGVLYLARRVEGDQVAVEGLDPETGERVWASRAPLPQPGHVGRARVIPWQGGAALVARVEDRALQVAFLAP